MRPRVGYPEERQRRQDAGVVSGVPIPAWRDDTFGSFLRILTLNSSEQARRLLDRILDAILQAYGDLKDPTFHFVGRSEARGEYNELIRTLSDVGEVTDETDPNTDVGRYLRIAADHGTWFLWLSYVGPFACLLRQRANRQFLAEGGVNTIEARVRALCERAGLAMLDASTLEHPIPLTLDKTEPENVRVFQALFSDSDLLPW